MEGRNMLVFDIAIDPAWRLPLLIIGATQARSKAVLGEETVDLAFGIAKVSIPYSNIHDLRQRSWSVMLSVGIKIAGDKTLGLIGSRQGVVQIALKEPTVRGVLFMRWPRNIAVSMGDPNGFIEAVQERLPMGA
jgi:hypothetical protein